MRALRRILGRASLLLLLGAALYLYAAHQAGRAELRALCEQGVEPKVYRRVSAEGYFDSRASCVGPGCWRLITESKFRYVEFEQGTTNLGYPIPDKGFYRLSVASISSGICNSRATEDLRSTSYGQAFLSQGRCVVVEKLKRPAAQFGIFAEKRDNQAISNVFGSEITSIRTYLKDMTSGSLIAERTSYLLRQNTLPSASSFANVVGCPDVGVRQVNEDIARVEAYVTPR